MLLSRKSRIFVSVIRIIESIFYIFIFACIAQAWVPVESNEIEIENSSGKIVDFIGMVHVARPQFYEDINTALGNFSNSKTLVLIEGIRPSKEDTHEDLQKLKKGLNDPYDNFSKQTGLIVQDYDIVLKDALKKGAHIDNVDATVHETVENVKNIQNSNKMSGPFDLKIPNSILKGLIRISLHKTELFAKYQNQAKVSQNFKIGQRNSFVVEKIEKTHYDRIAVVYGNEHWRNLWYQLKQKDPTWHIISRHDHKAF